MFSTAPISILCVGMCLFMYMKRNEESISYHRRLHRFLRGYLEDVDEMSSSVDNKGIHHDDYQEEQDLKLQGHPLPHLNGRIIHLYSEQIKQWEELSGKNPWMYEDEERMNWLEQSMANGNIRALMVREAALAKTHEQVVREFKWSN
jgi:hypothetical protein